jgi:fatty-acid desaturase
MYQLLVHTHSGLRWIVLLTLVVAIVNAIGKTDGSRAFRNKDRRLSLMALIFVHLQLIIGLILYFISPLVIFAGESMKNAILRFYLVEHILLMLVSIILITVGFSRAKRAIDEGKKFKNILVFYLIGLVLILISIPWPFRFDTAGWF